MTFRMNVYIAFTKLMLNNCFKEVPLMDDCIDLNF